MRTSNHARSGIAAITLLLAMWTVMTLVPVAVAQDTGRRAGPGVADEVDAYAHQTLRVHLWLNKDADQVYRRGERLNVTFQTNEDAYAVLYRIDVEGQATILWPTSRYSDGFVFGGHQYRLPSRDGSRIRVEDSEGQGYIHAVVSSYPFDLRDLELDFHHERGERVYDFYVAGDPFLAMNEINYAVTGLEDPSTYAVSNYVSYYVHRQVDHPRYLCTQCHDGDDSYDPYVDTCTVTIRHDYGWQNDWWPRYGFYPVYSYPVYVYVDPWSGLHWTNYWYDPWYHWPRGLSYRWDYWSYDWRYSPYWRYDVYAAHDGGHRRYRPLDRNRTRDRATVRTKNDLVRSEEPGADRLRAMKDRTVVASGERGASETRIRNDGPAGGSSRNVRRIDRDQPRFDSRSNTTLRTSPGLRLDRGRAPVRTGVANPVPNRDPKRNPSVQPGSRSPQRTRISPQVPQRDRGRQSIAPVQPRRDSSRVWSNRRSSNSPQQRRQTPPPSTDRSRPTPKKRDAVRSGGTPSRTRQESTVNRPAPRQAPNKPSTPPPSSPRKSEPRGKSGRTAGKSGGRG